MIDSMKPTIAGWVELLDRTPVRSNSETHHRAVELRVFAKGPVHPTFFAIAYDNIGDGEEHRSHRTKQSFVRCDRGGVIVHPQPMHPALLAAHPGACRASRNVRRPSPCRQRYRI